MSKKELIDSLFVILCLYEDAIDNEKSTTKEDYFTYLNRKYIFFYGRGNEEIACLLKGLQEIGFEVKHNELRSIVFHMISIIVKESGGGC